MNDSVSTYRPDKTDLSCFSKSPCILLKGSLVLDFKRCCNSGQRHDLSTYLGCFESSFSRGCSRLVQSL